jgi:hypothetical protein
MLHADALKAACDAAGEACREHGVEHSPGPLGASIVAALLGLGWTPPTSGGADLDDLLELHAKTTQKPWTIMPHTHEDTNIVEEGRGFFGLIAQVSTSTPDYGRANARFIVAAHREVPRLAAELASARKQLAP